MQLRNRNENKEREVKADDTKQTKPSRSTKKLIQQLTLPVFSQQTFTLNLKHPSLPAIQFESKIPIVLTTDQNLLQDDAFSWKHIPINGYLCHEIKLQSEWTQLIRTLPSHQLVCLDDLYQRFQFKIPLAALCDEYTYFIQSRQTNELCPF